MYHRMYFVHSLCQFDEQVFEAIRASSRGAAPRNQFDLSEAHAALSAHELELLVRYSFFDRASTALTRIKEAVEEAYLMRAHLEVHSFKSMAMYIGESHTDFSICHTPIFQFVICNSFFRRHPARAMRARAAGRRDRWAAAKRAARCRIPRAILRARLSAHS